MNLRGPKVQVLMSRAIPQARTVRFAYALVTSGNSGHVSLSLSGRLLRNSLVSSPPPLLRSGDPRSGLS
jgi:hypothetical protein